jgi:hypothetical protein
VAHPKLRVFVMHAGGFFYERAKAFGFLHRVMFGSDQMVWPEAVGVSIEAMQSLDSLTAEEKGAKGHEGELERKPEMEAHRLLSRIARAQACRGGSRAFSADRAPTSPLVPRPRPR